MAAALLMLGCGSEGGSGEDPEERGIPPEEFTPPPESCDPHNAEDLPLAHLPWRGTGETFLLPGWEADELALDYEVVPFPRVEEVVVSVDFDRTVDIEDRTYDTLCPSTVPLDFVEATGTTNDVVGARIWAGTASGTGRTGRVYLPVGEGMLTIRTEGLVPEEALEGEWWFVFEPAWGEPRVVLAPATVDRATFTVSNIPEGPGLVALVRTDEPRLDATRGVVHTRGGFAGRWSTATEAWYGATLSRYPEQPVSLAPVLPPGAEAALVRLEDAPTLAEGEMLFVRISPRETSGTVTVPCDQEVSLLNTGFAEVTVGVGEAARQLEPGAEYRVTVDCDAPASELSIDARSMNGRPAVLRAALAAEVL